MRSKYWCNSDFADWLRGTMKPSAETSSGWAAWRERAQKAYPIRYWLAEEGLDYIQKFLYWPIDRIYDVKYYINNRWVTGTHCLTAHPKDIPRGTWQDVGNRFLPCLFNELVDFIEIEQAWNYVIWSDEAQKKYSPPWWATGWFRWRTWRCPEAGMEYLEWASSLKNDDPNSPRHNEPTPQAEAAMEMMELYKWWTEEYPNRPDPHEASGWSEWCATRRDIFDFDNDTPEEREQSHKILQIANEIEDKYSQEEEDMMIRLIRIRESLWT